MALHLHRADRTDLLADGLGAMLADPPADPFAEDLVLVSARGTERWLSQRLSHILGRGSGQDGICAGVTFRHPRSLMAELTGTDEDDPWSPDAMVWPLLDVIDGCITEPWCATLATHLGHFADGEEKVLRQGRRYAVARRLAGLFDSYARQRPQLLIDWIDGRTGALDEDLRWQPELYRALLAHVDTEPPHIRHAETVARLRESPSELPQRLSMFGHTRLPATEIELLAALSTHHDLHLWLPHPSDKLWTSLRGVHGAAPRRTDTSHRDVDHPLLATLGRDLRELQRVLPADAQTDESLGPADRPDTLLGWLQSDLGADAVRPQGRSCAPGDRSVQVHSCHGAARQIDVLREVLLGLLADDPTLEPRDILVMCPDIETYAPLIVAGFGLGDVVSGAHPAHRLRVTLADRALTQTNPLLGVARQLLGLAGGRATASEVLNLAEAAPVRLRFGFTDDDLDAIGDWVREANIRWGFDRGHRHPYGVDFVQNTWRFGIDRVLAGVAMSDDSHAWLDTTLPLDDVSSNRVELAGRLAEYVDRLRSVVESLSGAAALNDWLARLSEGLDALTAVSDADLWQTSQVGRELADILAAAGAHADVELRLSDIRALLDRHLAGRPTRANFRTGTLTVCTMVPMRSVPHRVVCLVGLDDGVFPRSGVVDGDDVLARDPMTGERDIRSEDRQLLLDAIGAATEKLVITYTGANEYSGQRKPPAVPVMELLDTLDVTTSAPVRETVLVEHPLQPFDVDNVTPGKLGMPAGRPFTFDPTALTAATAAAGHRGPRPHLLGRPLPAPPPADVALDELIGFFKDPVKGFFRALDYTLPWDVEAVEDAMPVEIDALQEWKIGDRMLDDMLRGMTPADAQQAEWRRGSLPPGRLGWRKAQEIASRSAALAAAARQHRTPDPRAIDVDVAIGPARRVTGTVPRVYGSRTVAVTYSKLDGRHLLASWIRLVALTAHHPGTDWTAVCIGRGGRGGNQTKERLLGPPEAAAEVLRDLVAMYDAGRCAPIPLPLKTSYAWAETEYHRGTPLREAGWKWKTGRFPGEDAEPAHVRVWGPHFPLSGLVSAGLPDYSTRLWQPMLLAERNPA
ncbi:MULTISPECIES: exodeoxyribonuclease V subunit gamma [Mycolicibacterium]|jgi:exodeoxyribonuclease V gamma subunit|uniref:RecBCD enzyme subunit RecC n=2 Tax=Mycolicibacterium TaxID=1866885 RepID=A1T4E5_MYCVP|nr:MULTISPECIES: exodeoxyribonuclease V subunit gamma [Mycolicibacterium]ABM12045.1 DNA helicase/exodeoxyribonuclease V, gamma subunit [Mycolicibacterium vanbaalenii PYR-1]MDN4516280.1 exodeoxyribonuclease V subunit gamma [Mycolicibacterium austroafricanum]QRZ07867.1 exodeoxyribonuclease V subunit gamma [Mycolicibacterium austroafricanum]QZT69530.1 exodeoxyribonuclease V subunit gamma [Mycolicibacterium austroafricanum]QZY47316.1 exodeoxyribonuclease V subunit gamma [Mycolicibacterium austroaf